MNVNPDVAAGAAQFSRNHLPLADALDRILHRGVALQGNLSIGLADVELLFVDLRLLLGSVDAIWPEGRPTAAPLLESTPPCPDSDESTRAFSSNATRRAICNDAMNRPAIEPGDDRSKSNSSTAHGLVRLVLTLVKLLHEVLERQAVRRMEAGRLTKIQIERLGLALLAQAEEILLLQRQFGFSDQDLSVDLQIPDGTG